MLTENNSNLDYIQNKIENEDKKTLETDLTSNKKEEVQYICNKVDTLQDQYNNYWSDCSKLIENQYESDMTFIKQSDIMMAEEERRQKNDIKVFYFELCEIYATLQSENYESTGVKWSQLESLIKELDIYNDRFDQAKLDRIYQKVFVETKTQVYNKNAIKETKKAQNAKNNLLRHQYIEFICRVFTERFQIQEYLGSIRQALEAFLEMCASKHKFLLSKAYGYSKLRINLFVNCQIFKKIDSKDLQTKIEDIWNELDSKEGMISWEKFKIWSEEHTNLWEKQDLWKYWILSKKQLYNIDTNKILSCNYTICKMELFELICRLCQPKIDPNTSIEFLQTKLESKLCLISNTKTP